VSDAIISPCGLYRYTLHRRIPSVLRWVRPCLFIMLNPSTADATVDDPTIRRCYGFAVDGGCTSLTVVNLFALRATDPDELARAADPVGPDNDHHIREQIYQHQQIGFVIAAWGAHPMAPQRARQIAPLLVHVSALALTKDGWPRHPLYLPKKLEPQPWTFPT
jgi:hypothetical protein